MQELNELKETSNEVIKQSNELLEHLEENAELEEIQRELAELEIQHHKMNKIMLLGANVTALYTLMMIVKVIIVTIG